MLSTSLFLIPNNDIDPAIPATPSQTEELTTAVFLTQKMNNVVCFKDFIEEFIESCYRSFNEALGLRSYRE